MADMEFGIDPQTAEHGYLYDIAVFNRGVQSRYSRALINPVPVSGIRPWSVVTSSNNPACEVGRNGEGA